jgi:Rieske Fe-S protein
MDERHVLRNESVEPEQQEHRDQVALGPLPETTSRRRALLWLIRVSLAAFAAAFALPALALRTLRQEVISVASGDQLVYASGSLEGSPLNANDIPAGSAVQAFPDGKSDDSQNLIEVVKLSDDATDVVAYSAICTHLGCSVLPKLTAEGYIPCPCHGSFFDPANGAAVMSGPAGRPLPSLPIEVRDDGAIVATGEFSDKVGPN